MHQYWRANEWNGLSESRSLSVCHIPWLELIQSPRQCVTDVSHTVPIGDRPYYDGYSPQFAACSFTHSRGSRGRRVPTRSACEGSGRESLALRRTRECDALRRCPETHTRITWPPHGLPVRGEGTRDCRLHSSSDRSGHRDERAVPCALSAPGTPAPHPYRESDSDVQPRSLRWRPAERMRGRARKTSEVNLPARDRKSVV